MREAIWRCGLKSGKAEKLVPPADGSRAPEFLATKRHEKSRERKVMQVDRDTVSMAWDLRSSETSAVKRTRIEPQIPQRAQMNGRKTSS